MTYTHLCTHLYACLCLFSTWNSAIMSSTPASVSFSGVLNLRSWPIAGTHRGLLQETCIPAHSYIACKVWVNFHSLGSLMRFSVGFVSYQRRRIWVLGGGEVSAYRLWGQTDLSVNLGSAACRCVVLGIIQRFCVLVSSSVK